MGPSTTRPIIARFHTSTLLRFHPLTPCAPSPVLLVVSVPPSRDGQTLLTPALFPLRGRSVAFSPTASKLLVKSALGVGNGGDLGGVELVVSESTELDIDEIDID